MCVHVCVCKCVCVCVCWGLLQTSGPRGTGTGTISLAHLQSLIESHASHPPPSWCPGSLVPCPPCVQSPQAGEVRARASMQGARQVKRAPWGSEAPGQVRAPVLGARQPPHRGLQLDQKPRLWFPSAVSTSGSAPLQCHLGWANPQPSDHGLTSTACMCPTLKPHTSCSGCCQRARPGRLPRWPCPPCPRVPGLAMEPLPGNVHPDVYTRCLHTRLRMLSQPRTEGKAAWLGSLCKC